MKGTIKAISHKNKSVLIIKEDGSEQWFYLTGGIVTDNLRKGGCDFTTQSSPQGDEVINYLNLMPSSQNNPSNSGYQNRGYNRGYSRSGFRPSTEVDSNRQETINREWAINAAIQTIGLKPTVAENLTTLDEIEATVKELAKRYKKMVEGDWI